MQAVAPPTVPLSATADSAPYSISIVIVIVIIIIKFISAPISITKQERSMMH